MWEPDNSDLKLNAFAEFKIADWVAPACSTKCPKTRKSRTLVARHGGETMDARVRPPKSGVERIRRIQELGLGGAGLPDQVSEDEQKVVHKLLDTEGKRWM